MELLRTPGSTRIYVWRKESLALYGEVYLPQEIIVLEKWEWNIARRSPHLRGCRAHFIVRGTYSRSLKEMRAAIISRKSTSYCALHFLEHSGRHVGL